MTPPTGSDSIDGDDHVPAARDLDAAELAESAGVQNVMAVSGPGALLMIPLARLLTKVQRLLRRT